MVRITPTCDDATRPARGSSLMRRAPGLALVVGLFVLGACLNTPGDGDAKAESPAIGATLTGNYLAARHARAHRRDSDAADFLLAALEKSPDDPVLLGRTYVVLLLDGRVAQAAEIARRLLVFEDASVLATIVVAVDDLKQQQYAAADARLNTVDSDRITPFLRPLMRSWALYGQGRTDEALALLREDSRPPEQAALYALHSALLSDAAGDSKAAIAFADTAVADREGTSRRYIELVSDIYRRGGMPEKADALIAEFDNAEARQAASLVRDDDLPSDHPLAARVASPGDGAAQALLDSSATLSRQNVRELALVLAQMGLYLQPDFPLLQMLTANLLESLGRLEEANAVYGAIQPTSPLAPRGQLKIALNLDELDRIDEATALLERMAKTYPTDATPMIELGDILRRHERFGEAIDAYDEALVRIGTLAPRHWRILYSRGIALEREKRWDEAEVDFLRALEFEPEQPFVLNYLGYTWVEQGQNLDRALDMIRRAATIRPQDGYIVDSLGWVYYRLGRVEEAVIELERAVELQPEDPVINDHLGDAYWAVGRQREARYQWQQALVLDPEPELRAEIEAKLRERGLVKEANAGSR